MASHLVKSAENKSCKRPREMENETSVNSQLSSLEKPDFVFSENAVPSFYKAEVLEKVLNDMSKEINLLLTKYAQILSERAAVDASYIEEFDAIFKEASTLENLLKQKRESLRQRFTMIANTLQS
ncbi:testis-expressed protein 12 [Monodelphis domestica]|uniref:testis-expressed protein 12 n=1 Tax=Monodelphis domestica TaxID=13616 RepID=UPI00028BDC9F|nr:testis-expressed protein 12 [Monodelphis domestica]XP_056650374.1 testis-expressed protein 12 [Monodelphis domestica]XP_056650375.1 testis-expressed protein 12 [Monodelphis domestica]XP_056650376.1 testis-expressed protein 12 [Monodelphis domestica]XP_056650377.1 testis-expressed protein 12 [Monodelphis domestica]XP_056650378.1 testis-expressed protein 12 [Monodelphis domestica]XP_056650379.1 testis-expressed protein 12 [Monodelphis domestica]XP_056650380.1 testis-expressed protein 12 [Mo